MNSPAGLPFADAAEQNKQPILEVLRDALCEPGEVLEIGSGTGQHAVHFAAHLPHLRWQPSDLAPALPGIEAWRSARGSSNLLAPVALDVCHRPWPFQGLVGVFSANTAHIMPWEAVTEMFAGVGEALAPGGRFCLYGPFHYGGHPTSESNARFDLYIRDKYPGGGVRDVDDLQGLAAAAGLSLWADYAMPVNNRTLVWAKAAPAAG